ncbi:hypothetical protein NMG60_11022538 [Bertholletia excelsa]
MEAKKIAAAYALLLILSMASSPSLAVACPPNGRQCRDCILDRFRNDCPPCKPILRCMARCLWGGASRAKCTKKCDCGSAGSYPRLSDCKKCMYECKCSCAV